MKVTKEQFLSSNNLLENAKDVTIDDLIEVAESIAEFSEFKHVAGDLLSYRAEGEGVDTDSSSSDLLVLTKGKEETSYAFTPQAKTQFLATGCELPYGFFSKKKKKDAEVRQFLVDTQFHTNKMYKLEILKDDDGDVIRGFLVAKAQAPLSDLDMLRAVKKFIENGELQVRLTHVVYNMNVVRFKIIIDSEKRVIGDNDEYIFGIQVVHSVNESYPTTLCPMLIRSICDNGLVDIAAQKAILQQRSLSVPADALDQVFERVLKWIVDKKSDGLFDILKAVHDANKKVSVKSVKALLKDYITTKIPTAYQKMYTEAILKGLPDSDSKSVNVYEVFQMFTAQAKELPPEIQLKVEANVAGYLLALAKDKEEQEKKGESEE